MRPIPELHIPGGHRPSRQVRGCDFSFFHDKRGREVLQAEALQANSDFFSLISFQFLTSLSYRPYIVVERFVVVTHAAIPHMDDPSVARIVDVAVRRPVDAGLHI